MEHLLAKLGFAAVNHQLAILRKPYTGFALESFDIRTHGLTFTNNVFREFSMLKDHPLLLFVESLIVL